MSSFYEGSPNVLLDSINNSTPILASNCSGVSDIIGKDKGYTFKNNDENDLYKKLINIIDNYEPAINRAKLAHKNLKKFSINNSKIILIFLINEKKFKISIITVCLNSEKTIERCIKSVLNQKYNKANIELIIIDGKSIDRTIKIIEKYKSKIFHFESKKDKGIYDAMNKGIKMSTGDIIGILNSDDFYYPDTFNIVNKYFNKYKIDYLFGSVDHLKIYHGFYPKKYGIN